LLQGILIIKTGYKKKEKNNNERYPRLEGTAAKQQAAFHLGELDFCKKETTQYEKGAKRMCKKVTAEKHPMGGSGSTKRRRRKRKQHLGEYPADRRREESPAQGAGLIQEQKRTGSFPQRIKEGAFLQKPGRLPSEKNSGRKSLRAGRGEKDSGWGGRRTLRKLLFRKREGEKTA